MESNSSGHNQKAPCQLNKRTCTVHGQFGSGSFNPLLTELEKRSQLLAKLKKDTAIKGSLDVRAVTDLLSFLTGLLNRIYSLQQGLQDYKILAESSSVALLFDVMFFQQQDIVDFLFSEKRTFKKYSLILKGEAFFGLFRTIAEPAPVSYLHDGHKCEINPYLNNRDRFFDAIKEQAELVNNSKHIIEFTLVVKDICLNQLDVYLNNF